MAVNPDRGGNDSCCAVIELRQYTLYPGKRDVLIDLFDREFIESQEAVGMHIVGQFRDADNPDRFVWMRGFADMPARGAALTAFYDGPVWQAHRDTANPTMIDASNVLLLRPLAAGSGFAAGMPARAPVGAVARADARVVATIYYLHAPLGADFIRFFEQEVKPAMTAAGAAPIAAFQSEPAGNNFPRLPVRVGEHVLIWFARFDNATQFQEHERRLAQSKQWQGQVLPALLQQLKSPPERLMLEPTARSQLR